MYDDYNQMIADIIERFGAKACNAAPAIAAIQQ